MAEAIYNKMTNSNDATSAGTYTGAPDEPEGQKLTNLMTEQFFRFMDSHGLDLRNKTTRRLTPEILKDADVVVSMAEEPYRPDYLRADSRVIWWDVPDGRGVEETYPEILTRVKSLAESLRRTG